MHGERGVFFPFSYKQSEALRQARLRFAAMTPSELEPVNIKWIPLTPGRAVQYNGELEIERMWQQA